MNDGKYKLAIVDRFTRKEIPTAEENLHQTNGRLALTKITNGETIPDDEPIFILRARDRNAVLLLQAYWWFCFYDGCNDYQMSMLAQRMIEFEQWAEKNPSKMKQPGITRGA